MATQIVNTKIEKVVEAFESLAIATAAPYTGPAESRMDNILMARADLAAALREFLAPTLRVVQAQ